MSNSESKPVIIHTHEGVICDTIEFQIGEDGPKCTLPNGKAGWSAVNTHARPYGGIHRHTKWDHSHDDTPWLESAPYKHRKRWLDARFNEILDKVSA